MKTTKAWALVDQLGRMAVISGQLPIYWRRKAIKEQWMHSILRQGFKVVRVEIRELKPKRKARK